MTAYTWTATYRQQRDQACRARRAALIEDVAWLLQVGTAPCVIAQRLGYARVESLQRHLYRLGRRDLAAQLAPALPRRPR